MYKLVEDIQLGDRLTVASILNRFTKDVSKNINGTEVTVTHIEPTNGEGRHFTVADATNHLFEFSISCGVSLEVTKDAKMPTVFVKRIKELEVGDKIIAPDTEIQRIWNAYEVMLGGERLTVRAVLEIGEVGYNVKVTTSNYKEFILEMPRNGYICLTHWEDGVAEVKEDTITPVKELPTGVTEDTKETTPDSSTTKANQFTNEYEAYTHLLIKQNDMLKTMEDIKTQMDFLLMNIRKDNFSSPKTKAHAMKELVYLTRASDRLVNQSKELGIMSINLQELLLVKETY